MPSFFRRTSTPSAPTGRFGSSLLRNLLAGVRAALFRRVGVDHLAVTSGQLAALTLVSLVAPLLHGLFGVGAHGEFDWAGLGVALLINGAIVAIAALLSSGSGDDAKLLPGAIALLALFCVLDLLFVELAGYRGAGLPPWVRAHYAAIVDAAHAIWLTLAGALLLVRLLALRGAARAGAFCAVALLAGVVIAPVVDRTLWAAPTQASAEDLDQQRRGEQMAAESTLYAQSELLERALAKLRPPRPGLSNIYFVGVAGDASQDVFMKEVLYTAKQFETRFDTAGRSVLLINNPATLQEHPLASVTSLQQVLYRIGTIMNPEEDFAFVFLTSHGSRNRGFSFSAQPLGLDALTPQRLKDMLDDAGIKQRVVVVSACFSGVFVEPLADPTTLVITAAAADKRSFGCENEAEFTYFGHAFFAQALNDTRSFRDAFEQAKQAVGRRERSENFEPSEPQIAGGEELDAKLGAIEQRLNASAPSPSSPSSPSSTPSAEPPDEQPKN